MFDFVIGNKKYLKMDDSQKAYWLSTWVANTHHLFVVCWVYMSFYYSTCPGGYPFAWFTEDRCFYHVELMQCQSAMITCGYLTYDFCVQKFLVKDTSNLAN